MARHMFTGGSRVLQQETKRGLEAHELGSLVNGNSIVSDVQITHCIHVFALVRQLIIRLRDP